MKALFNAYKPEPIEIEYADVIEQEQQPELKPIQGPDPESELLDCFEESLPADCPFPTDEDPETGIRTLLCSDTRLYFWIGEQLEYIEDDLSDLARAYLQEDFDAFDEYMSNGFKGDYDFRLNDALQSLVVQKYNLSW